MTDDLIEAAVVEAIHEVAPEATVIPPDVNLREELDLDSMDFLNVLVGIQKRLGVEVPETDYAKVQTLAGAVAYLKERRAPA